MKRKCHSILTKRYNGPKWHFKTNFRQKYLGVCPFGSHHTRPSLVLGQNLKLLPIVGPNPQSIFVKFLSQFFSPKQRKKSPKYSFQIQKKIFFRVFYEILKYDFFSKTITMKLRNFLAWENV